MRVPGAQAMAAAACFDVHFPWVPRYDVALMERVSDRLGWAPERLNWTCMDWWVGRGTQGGMRGRHAGRGFACARDRTQRHHSYLRRAAVQRRRGKPRSRPSPKLPAGLPRALLSTRVGAGTT